jgi:hypothetical protein
VGKEARVFEHLEVVADSWLAETQRFGEVADTSLTFRLGLYEAQEANAGGIGEGLEGAGKLLGLIRRERGPRDRRAARQDAEISSHCTN